MGKKSPPPKAPDLKPITDAQTKIAEESNELAREYLGLSREQFAYMQENAKEELALAREQADRLFQYQDKAFASDEDAKAFAREVGQKQIESMNLQMDYAQRDRERYESKFLPMQDRYIDEANAYDTQARREEEAARASVDIQRQAEAARANSDQRLRSMGIDPSQMRSASLLDTQQVALASQQAGAANAARQGVEDRGRAMRADALNVGAGLPAQALAGFNSSAGAGNSAVNAGQAGQQAQLGAIQGGAGVGNTALGFRSSALQNLAGLTGSPTQWAGMGSNALGQASSAYGNAANTASQSFQNQMGSWKAGQEQSQQMFNNIMSVGSMAAGMMMAEGGTVSREKIRFDEPVREGVSFSAPAKGQSFEQTWAQRAQIARAANDPYMRGGGGSGKGGALTFGDRAANGATAARQFSDAASNGYSDYDEPLMTRQTQLGGNALQFAAEGSRVVPKKQARDRYPAMLAEGEYVVPRDVVDALGVLHFDKMVKKYHRSNA